MLNCTNQNAPFYDADLMLISALESNGLLISDCGTLIGLTAGTLVLATGIVALIIGTLTRSRGNA